MGRRKNKRGKAAEAHGGSPARKKGGSVDKDRSEEKQVGAVMECDVVSKSSETNNNSGVVVIEGENRQIAMTLKDLVAAMECDNQTVSDENSEGEVMSEEERRSSTKSSSSLSSEISEERIRRQIQERNLKKLKMVRTRRGLVYETDLIEEDRKYMGKRDNEYKHSHIGIKVVETSLIPSARDNNNESNKSSILGYVYSQGHKVVEVKKSGFGRVDLIFKNCRDANRCLKDKGGEGVWVNILISLF